MLTNREVVQAKIETTYGTDAVPVAGTDDILVENISWSNEGLRMTARPAVRASLGELQHIYGGTLRGITFDVELKGAGGAVDVPPEVSPLLRACGLDETINAATDVTYGPVSAALESITIYYFQDGIRYNLLGCVGNVSFNLETGMPGKMSFTFVGHLVGPTDTALIGPTYDSVVPAPLLSVPFDIGGFSAVINALTFDMGNTIAQVPDMGASDGYGEVRITKRDVNGSYDPEADLIAADNPESDLRSGSILALDTGVVGSTLGNRYQVTMAAVSYRDYSPADREGVRTYEIPFGAAESSGDDDVIIVFT